MSATERVLAVLALFIEGDGPLSAQQVATSLSMPLATAYRHLNLLKRKEFLSDIGRDSGFSLGPAAFRMAARVERRTALASAAISELQHLVQETQESAGLMRLVGGQIFCHEMVESAQPLRCSFAKGGFNALNRGATAKAILAFMDDAQRIRILRQLGCSDILNPAELSEIRNIGYAESEGAVDVGVWGVSAPIYSAPGQFEACVTLMAPAMRVTERRADLIAALVTKAKNITNLLTSTSNQQGNM